MKKVIRSSLNIAMLITASLAAGALAGCASSSESAETPAPANEERHEVCTVECASFAGEGFAAEFRACMDECLAGGDCDSQDQ